MEASKHPVVEKGKRAQDLTSDVSLNFCVKIYCMIAFADLY